MMDEVSGLVDDTPLFRDLDEPIRRNIAGRLVPVRLEAGAQLFAAGAPAAELYLVVSGRLAVLSAHGDVLRLIGPGSVLGELAVLTDAPRSATVAAQTPCELLRLSRVDFEAIAERHPAILRALCRLLAGQLAASQVRLDLPPPPRRRTALVALDADAPVAIVARSLHAALRAQGTEAQIVAADDEDLRAAARRLEILIVTDPADVRQARALAAADRVVGIASKDPGSSASVAGVTVDRILTIGDDGMVAQAPITRLARRVAGLSVGLALSAGGARAFAHIGVLQALDEAGVVIDRVVGTSFGAFVGALHAAGLSAVEMHERLRPLATGSFMFEHGADSGRALIEATLPDLSFAEAHCDYACISADLVSGKRVVHRSGPMRDAVTASMALPAVLPPVITAESVLVDGAAIDGLPVDLLYDEGDGPVLASDVSGRAGRVSRVAERWRRSPSEPIAPYDVALQVLDLGGVEAHSRALRLASLVIQPQVPISTLAFHEIDRLVEAGHTAAVAALAKAPASIASSLGIAPGVAPAAGKGNNP